MSNLLYFRECQIIIGNRSFTSPPFSIDFSVDFTTGGKPAQATVKLLNPNDETVAACEKQGTQNQNIIINAGYHNDVGNVFLGEIQSHTSKKQGSGRVLEIKAGDKSGLWQSARVSRTWGSGISAVQVMTDILSDLGIQAGKIEPDEPKVYHRGITLNTTLPQAMKQLANDTNSEFYLRNGRAFFQSKSVPGTRTGVLLNSDTGLIGNPEKSDKKWKLKSLFQYRIQAGELVRVQSRELNSDLKVINGKHKFSDSSSLTEFEAVLL